MTVQLLIAISRMKNKRRRMHFHQNIPSLKGSMCLGQISMQFAKAYWSNMRHSTLGNQDSICATESCVQDAEERFYINSSHEFGHNKIITVL